jgi:hypothetical protein
MRKSNGRRKNVTPKSRRNKKRRRTKRRHSAKTQRKPRHTVWSTKRWIRSSSAENAAVEADFQAFEPHEEVHYTEGNSLDGLIDERFQARTVMSRPAFVAVVRKGRVWGRHGAVLTPDNRILGDVYWEFTSKFILVKKPSLFRKWKPHAIKAVSGTVGVLTHPGSANYFHWLFDVLPRIDLLRRSGRVIDKYVIHRDTIQPYHDETLNMLGIPPEKRIYTNNHFHIKANRLVVPSLMSDFVWAQGHYPQPVTYSKWACHFVRNELISSDSAPLSGGSERLYISRAHADKRRLLNEEEIMAKLASLGFAAISPDSLTVKEQIRLFASAEAIVAPHGAGLANLAFCRPGTKVVELFSPAYIPVYYWILSSHFGLDYSYLIGDRAVWNQKTWAGATDFHVDPDRFDRVLIRAGIA